MALVALASVLISSVSIADESAEQVSGVESSVTVDRPLAVDLGSLPLETLDINQLERGQKGYGLSVFAGEEPERFEVEVVGVWRGNSPEMSYLLATLSGKDLERSGVMQGMSGSPVFIDGKLVGAVSFSFNFGLDPIAGITPIDSMRSLATAGGGLVDALPASASKTASSQGAPARVPAGAVPSFDDVLHQRFDAALLDTHLSLLAPPQALAGASAAISWSAGGFQAQARDLLDQRLGALIPLSGGGTVSSVTGISGVTAGAAGSAATVGLADGSDLGPGDAVALVLARGDLSLAAHGTVTDRVGDSIFAFGHPVYSLGPIRLPMARSEVITTIPSRSSSFKLSNTGDLIGVFDQDREPGAHGVLGVQPTLVPMHIKLRGLAQRDYRMELADSSMFKPTLIAVTTLGALSSGSYSTGLLGIDIEARLRLRGGREDLVLSQSFDGSQAAMDAVIYLLTYASFLELNELEPTSIEGVEVRIEQFAKPRVTQLLGARSEKRRVRAGETVKAWLDVRPHGGERERRAIDVKIPGDTPAGRYWVMVGDGTSMDAARLLIEKKNAENFDQQLDMIRSLHSRKQLHFMGLTASQGRALAGDVLPDLPPSMRAIYGGEGQGLELRITDESVEPSAEPLEGIFRLDFVVEEDS